MGLLDAIPRDLGRIQATEKSLAREVFMRPKGAAADGSGDIALRGVFGNVYLPQAAPGGTAHLHGSHKELLLQKSALPHVPERGRDSFVVDGVVYDVILLNDDGLDLLTIKIGRRQGRNMPGWEARP